MAVWQELTIPVRAPDTESLETLLSEVGALGFCLQDAADVPIYEPRPGETPLWPLLSLQAYFPEETDLTPALLHLALQGVALDQVRLRPIGEQDWATLWQQTWRPLQFGQQLWVCPVGERPAQADAIVVELDPGMAFGTGTHATTALCLAWLAAADLTGKTVLDYGCGSGILAIAALKLGAARAVAVDYDPQALRATTQNAAQNGVNARLEVCPPDALPTLCADITLANILANPLIELAPLLISATRPGGALILSGILAEQGTDVLGAYAPPCHLLQRLQQEDWLRLDLQTPP